MPSPGLEALVMAPSELGKRLRAALEAEGCRVEVHNAITAVPEVIEASLVVFAGPAPSWTLPLAGMLRPRMASSALLVAALEAPEPSQVAALRAVGVGDVIVVTREAIALGPSVQVALHAAPTVRRLLVVDDSGVNRRVICDLLERLGFTADEVAGGLEALTALEQQRYDLVIMDCQMPELDGYETTRRLRSREAGEPRLPIIALTASSLPGDREKCLAAGMDDYLCKPVTLAGLGEMLARWLPQGV